MSELKTLSDVLSELMDIRDALAAIQGIVGDSDNINNGARYLLSLTDARLEKVIETIDIIDSDIAEVEE